MTTAYIGLGSNEGDRLAHLGAALEALAEIPETHIDSVSTAYESEPAFVEGQPRFANAVVALTTTLQAEQLLEYLQSIEDSLGRIRTEPKGPRTIDLDILLFGDEEIASETLTVPQERLLEREFAVVPLLEISPRHRMPDGTPITREGATLGPIIGELGPVPDLGVARNEPVATPDWVEVATCDASAGVTSGWQAAISLQREVLADAGIPYAFDPYEPDVAMDPWGLPRTFSILVPAEYAEQATTLIAEVMAAEPDFPEELEE